uniref:Uncharacterized protein n=1 Tax=Glossina palpalis gambiensis TaxID=67801 RepID=A0A1B0BAD9_9MUSC
PCSERQQLKEICSSIQSKASCTDIISATSHLIICRRDCKEFASEERSCSMRSIRRANPTTCKSAFNKLLTIAAPMPELAPVTTAHEFFQRSILALAGSQKNLKLSFVHIVPGTGHFKDTRYDFFLQWSHNYSHKGTNRRIVNMAAFNHIER